MNKAPELEQKLCVACGFCCDNTLFDIAGIKPNEKVPAQFEELQETKDDHSFWRLPCPYFDCKCTIYNQKKPIVCSSFRCEILKETSNNKIELKNALKIINDVKKERDYLIKEFNSETGDFKTFRQLLWALRNLAWEKKLNPKLQELYHRAQLLNVHIVSNFRSNDSFDDQFETLENYD